jgi:hypothetical protein
MLLAACPQYLQGIVGTAVIHHDKLVIKLAIQAIAYLGHEHGEILRLVVDRNDNAQIHGISIRYMRV